ncbi:MAG: hypothetical protein JO325_15615 [Solirubrobacterales bacterium]|nr:hypothetical protein [Solirubrobacterales bacterium]
MIRSFIPRATFRGTLPEGPDGRRIDRLAALSASRPPEGVVLLAEVEGEPVAAIGLFDGQTVSDPARSSLAVRMRLHALRLQLLMIVSLRGF